MPCQSHSYAKSLRCSWNLSLAYTYYCIIKILINSIYFLPFSTELVIELEGENKLTFDKLKLKMK